MAGTPKLCGPTPDDAWGQCSERLATLHFVSGVNVHNPSPAGGKGVVGRGTRLQRLIPLFDRFSFLTLCSLTWQGESETSDWTLSKILAIIVTSTIKDLDFPLPQKTFCLTCSWNLTACCWSGISLANKSIAESKFEACRRTLLQIMGATGPINSFSISFNTVRIRWGSISSSVFFSGSDLVEEEAVLVRKLTISAVAGKLESAVTLLPLINWNQLGLSCRISGNASAPRLLIQNSATILPSRRLIRAN